MVKKSQRVDAFIDESVRGQTYYLCAVIVPLESQSQLRRNLKSIATKANKRRIHFNHLTDQKKFEVLLELEEKIEVLLINTHIMHDIREEDARQKCMAVLVLNLQKMGVQRMNIENRSLNRHDELTIMRVRSTGPKLDFVHLSPYDEELLWCADAIAWVYGAGRFWIEKLQGITQRVIQVP